MKALPDCSYCGRPAAKGWKSLGGFYTWLCADCLQKPNIKRLIAFNTHPARLFEKWVGVEVKPIEFVGYPPIS